MSGPSGGGEQTASQPLDDVTLWAIDDMVRIDPETGTAFEDNPTQLPGGLPGDYRSRNAVWSAADQTVHLCGARNEVVAPPRHCHRPHG